jgi:iron complex outermembrane receptor protein
MARGTIFLSLATSVIAGMPLAAAHGQAAAVAPDDRGDAVSTSGQIEDIVVTARRVSESVQKVPLAITVLSETALRDNTIHGVRDLQGTAPALYITTGNGGPSAANIGIRGQTQADVLLTTEPSVAVYLNEVSLPRQVGLRAAFLDVDQVEVLKGPQGTLFGKNTTGGALLLRTKRPNLEVAEGYLQGTAGNLGLLQVTGALSVPLVTDQLAVRLAAQHSSRDGFARNASNQRLGGQNDRAVRGSMLWEPGEKLTLLLTGDYSKATDARSHIRVTGINSFVMTPAGQPGNALASVLNQIATELQLPRTAAGYQAAYNAFVDSTMNTGGYYRSNSVLPIESYLKLYGFSGDLSLKLDGVTIRSITGYRNYNRSETQDLSQSRFQIIRPTTYSYADVFSQELQLLGNSDGPFDWITGAYYSREKGEEGSNTVSVPGINPGSPNIQDATVTNKTYGAFAQLSYAFTDTLKATGGFRYTKVTQDTIVRNRNALGCLVPVALRPDLATCSAGFDTGAKKPSYLVSLDWQATPTILVYAKTSSSFRGGGINLRGQSTTSTAPFTAFGPETATDYEVGFKGDLLDRRLRVNAAAFYTDYRDIQRSSRTIVNSAPVTVVNNAAKGRVYGGELEVTYRPVDGFTFAGSANYTNTGYTEFTDATGVDRSGEPFAIPKWQYQLSGKYETAAASGQLSFFAAWRWQDDVTFAGTALNRPSVTQPGFGLLEGRVAYRLDVDPRFELALFGRNLLDKKFYTNAIDFDAGLGFNVAFVGDPRVVGVELRFSFGG